MKKRLQTAFTTRQSMKDENFEIYYYQDNNLEKVAIHSHDFYEFYFFLEGNVSMHVEEQDFHLKKGDILLISPGTKHFISIDSDKTTYRRFVMWISKPFYEKLISEDPSYGYIIKKAEDNKCCLLSNNAIMFNSLNARMFHLIEGIHSYKFGKDAQISLDLRQLLLHINRLMFEHDNPKSPLVNLPVYEMVLDYIETHIADDLSLETISSYLHLNKYHVAHVFKENIGMSIHQYVIKKRLDLCREALEKNSDITKIYMLYGFNDYSSFYRAFKKEYGMSPKEFICVQ